MNEYRAYFTKLEDKYRLPPGYLYAIAMAESRLNPKAESKSSTAKGMFQYTAPTAKDRGINPLDWKESAETAAKDAADRFKQLGSWDLVAQAHKLGDTGIAKGQRDPAYLREVRTFHSKPWAGEAKIIRVDPTKVYTDIPSIPKAPVQKYDPTEGMSTGDKLLAGIGSGLYNVGRGTLQTGLGIADTITPSKLMPETAAWIEAARRRNQEAIDEQNRLDKPLLDTGAGMAGNIIGQAAPMALVPGGFGARTAMQAARIGAGQGVVNALTTSRASEVDPLMHLGLNVGAGAAFNPMLYQAGKVASAGAGHFREFVKKAGQDIPNPALERFRAAKASNIPVGIGDIDPSSRWKMVEDFSEYLPYSGRRGFMKKQAEATEKAVSDFARKFEPNIAATGGEKDPGRIMFNSILDEYGARKATAKGMFDTVENLAKAQGVDYINPSATFRSASNLLQDYPELLKEFGDKKVEDSLKLVKNYFDPQNVSKMGLPNFGFMRELRTNVGYLLRQAEKKAAAGNINEQAVRRLNQLYAAINQDITDWGTQNVANSAVAKAYSDASKFYVDKIDPFKRIPVLNELRFLNKDQIGLFDTDRLVGMVTGRGRGARADQLLANMDQTGRDAAEYALIEKAKEAAVNPNLESGLSNLAFLRNMNLGSTRDRVLNPTTLNEAATLETAVRAARRGSGFTHNPPTGARLTAPMIINTLTGMAPLGLGASDMLGITGGGFAPALIAGLGAAGASRAMTGYTASDIGKRIFLADPQKYPAFVKTALRTASPALTDYIYGLLEE